MASLRTIGTYLESCTLNASDGCVEGTGLTAIYKTIFGNPGFLKKVSKDKMVWQLTDFYADKQNITNIWNGLSECEREVMGYTARINGHEFGPALTVFAKKYGIDTSYTTRWGEKQDLLTDYQHYLKYLQLLKNSYTFVLKQIYLLN